MVKLLFLEDTYLSYTVGHSLSKQRIVTHTFSRFKDGEMFIELNTPVRGDDVVIFCSICEPVNDNLMKVLITCDALKRASAKSIILFSPYLGYSRQDRKTKPRQPITAKLVADLLQVAGVDRLITFDLHSSQIEGFYNIPLDNIPVLKVFGHVLGGMFKNELAANSVTDYVVVSPDHGGFVRAKEFAEEAHISNMAIINKYREKANEVSSMQVIGDVKGKICIIVDDLVDTGGTLMKASEELMKLGAKEVNVFCTHGVLSGDAITKLATCQEITKIYVSDSIDKRHEILGMSPTVTKIYYQDVTDIVLAVLGTIITGGSLAECIKNLLEDKVEDVKL